MIKYALNNENGHLTAQKTRARDTHTFAIKVNPMNLHGFPFLTLSTPITNHTHTLNSYLSNYNYINPLFHSLSYTHIERKKERKK